MMESNRQSCALNLVRRAAVVLAIVLAAMPSAACAYEKYKYFRTIIAPEQASFQLKLTYMGKQAESPWTLILHAKGEAADAKVFEEFHRRGVSYANDARIRSAEVSAPEIAALVSNIGSLPLVTDPAAGRAGVFVIFTMLAREPTKRAFESYLAREEIGELFEQMRRALAGNASASRLVDEFAAMAGSAAVEQP